MKFHFEEKDFQKLKKEEIPNGKVIIRKANGKIRVVNYNFEKSRTQQHFKDDCDINKIIARAQKQGQRIDLMANSTTGVYADMTQIPDYQGGLQMVINAQQKFSELPSNIRQRFANNPQLLIDFLGDKNNKEEGIKLGLIKDPKKKQPSEMENLTAAVKENTASRTKKEKET